MFFKATIRFAIAASALFSVAEAQIESGGLGALDPWALGFLSPSETPLPQTLWRASSTEMLLPLMQTVRTRALTPAERSLLRRVILSAGRPPSGEQSAELLAERARIMFEIGEASAAADLLPRLSLSPEGVEAEELSADLQLALGQEASACAKARVPGREGEFWLKMRAVCFALEGNIAGADLAVEIARSNGVDDTWFLAAVIAASGGADTKPTARFDSGLSLALSTKADLPQPVNAVSNSRPDLAAAMAIRPSLPPELRVLAAGVAAETGLLSADAHRAAYIDLIASDGFNPGSPVEAALVIAGNDNERPAAKARAIGSALRAAKGDSARFAAVARLLSRQIDALEPADVTARQAVLLSAAKLASGDAAGAHTWIQPPHADGDDQIDPFELAWFEGLAVLAGAGVDEVSMADIATRLVAHADGNARRGAAKRLLTLMTVFDVIIPAPARALLVTSDVPESDTPARHVPAEALLAGAGAKAAGEVILLALSATDGEPAALSTRDLVHLLSALREIGETEAARALALEATGYWKPSLG